MREMVLGLIVFAVLVLFVIVMGKSGKGWRQEVPDARSKWQQ